MAQKRLQPLLQQEQVEIADENLEKFHRENPHRYSVADAIYKRFRARQKQRGSCQHQKSTQRLLLEALGYDVPKPIRPDYNIGWHTLPDGTDKIWCLTCGQPFTREEAKKLMGESTNSHSSSEVIFELPQQQETKAVYFDPMFVKKAKQFS